MNYFPAKCSDSTVCCHYADYKIILLLVRMNQIKKTPKLGYTTGTCAQAAAKGAVLMLAGRRIIKKVNIETPSSKRLNLKLIEQKIGKNFASCAVVKDSGDDPDVTDGIKIFAKVRYCDGKNIIIRGGRGIGKVTKPGLAVKIGESAINPVPIKMITRELLPFLPQDKGIEAIISAPEGARIAKQTFNSNLGIFGGISIIGTTGIVEPKSTSAYQRSLSLQLNVLTASRYTDVVLILGYVGEQYCKNKSLDKNLIIKIGDHVGYMLKECAQKKIKRVLLAGHIGKLIKIANGQFDTNIKYGDNRVETIGRFARNCGAGKEVIARILKQKTAEATIDILRENNLSGVFHEIAKKVMAQMNKLTKGKLACRCALLSLKSEELL